MPSGERGAGVRSSREVGDRLRLVSGLIVGVRLVAATSAHQSRREGGEGGKDCRIKIPAGGGYRHERREGPEEEGDDERRAP